MQSRLLIELSCKLNLALGVLVEVVDADLSFGCGRQCHFSAGHQKSTPVTPPYGVSCAVTGTVYTQDPTPPRFAAPAAHQHLCLLYPPPAAAQERHLCAEVQFAAMGRMPDRTRVVSPPFSIPSSIC